MNPTTTPTPRTDEARQKAFSNQNADQNADYLGYVYMANHAEKLERELTEKTSEVARLRELLYCCASFMGLHSRVGAARSTASELRNRIIAQIAPAHEWRELGEDEVIQEGDKYRSDVSLTTWPVSSVMIGKPARNFPDYSFRTSRPLPKSENLLDREATEKQTEKSEDLNEDLWRELGPDEVIGADDEYNPASLGEWIKVPHGWIGEKCDITCVRTRRPLPKQEEIRMETPLDLDIEEIEAIAKTPECALSKPDYNTRQIAIHSAHAIRYLRDEIQKLKEEK